MYTTKYDNLSPSKWLLFFYDFSFLLPLKNLLTEWTYEVLSPSQRIVIFDVLHSISLFSTSQNKKEFLRSYMFSKQQPGNNNQTLQWPSKSMIGGYELQKPALNHFHVGLLCIRQNVSLLIFSLNKIWSAYYILHCLKDLKERRTIFPYIEVLNTSRLTPIQRQSTTIQNVRFFCII